MGRTSDKKGKWKYSKKDGEKKVLELKVNKGELNLYQAILWIEKLSGHLFL